MWLTQTWSTLSGEILEQHQPCRSLAWILGGKNVGTPYPAYIAWEEFVANQAQLHANSLNYREERPGMARKGQALLQGIVRCGRCGALLHLHYSGRQGEFPVYRCSADQGQFGGTDCQHVRALALDTQVEQRFLEALRPDQLTLALAALAQLEQEEQAESKQWELRLERARYQAKRAER